MRNGLGGSRSYIVDNSGPETTTLGRIEEWASTVRAFDIATGYFDIGSLLDLDGKWQRLDKIRILLGAETTQRTRDALREAALRGATDCLDGSLDDEKVQNPFLRGVGDILDALASGQIECRVYDKATAAAPLELIVFAPM